jgi:hypothetical protein
MKLNYVNESDLVFGSFLLDLAAWHFFAATLWQVN